MAHAGHGFTHTEIEHHDDGSHTITPYHESGDKEGVPSKYKKHAKMDLDGLHDSLEDLLRHPMDEHEKLEEQIHPGIHKEMMEKAEEKGL